MSDLAKGMVFGQWTLIDKIDFGGNSQVWKAQNSFKEFVAIKVLIKKKAIAHKRFCDEIKIMQDNAIDGIIPIIDSSPNKSFNNTERYWYTMPVGTPLLRYINNKTLTDIVGYFHRISDVLVYLHSKNITHRDIKPANILFINNKVHLGDFGLVDYPDKEDITFGGTLGARWTMAPEIRRHKDNGDTRPADVYSLAKSLWITITKINVGFDGKYSNSDTISIRHYVDKSDFVDTLEELLSDSTEHEPSLRPKMDEFRDRLAKWLNTNSNFEESNSIEWNYAQRRLFPICTPRQAQWKKLEDIVTVLNTIGPKTNLNHLFFPTGGGLDLEGANLSLNEKGCIEIKTDGLISLLKPQLLQFEGFGVSSEWDYFRLECAELKPSGVYLDIDKFGYEEVVDIGDGRYIQRIHFDENEYNDKPLPDNAKLLSRHFRGAFVIFQKTSVYNRIPETYDAIHSKMNAVKFRELIEKLIHGTQSIP